MLPVLAASTLRPELRWPEIKHALKRGRKRITTLTRTSFPPVWWSRRLRSRVESWWREPLDDLGSSRRSTSYWLEPGVDHGDAVDHCVDREKYGDDVDDVVRFGWGVVEVDNANKRRSCQNDIKRPPHPKWLQQGSWQRWVHRLSCLRGDFSHDNYDDNFCGDHWSRAGKQKIR